MPHPYDDTMMDDEDIPDDQDQDELSPPPRDWPPNTYWNEKKNKWQVLRPPQDDQAVARYKRLGINANSENPGEFDPTWGYDRPLNPRGNTKEDQWLKSVYEKRGWALPPEEGPPTPPPVNGNRPTEVPTEDYGTYKYFGTDPHQDWDVDLGYLKPAPPWEFEAEPWVPPEDFTYPAYEQPPAYQKPEDFSYAPFIGPTAEEVRTEDPSYQFRLDEGRRLMEASAASRGTLRGGATIKGLIDYGQDAASQEWQNVWARDLEAHEANQRAAADAYAANLGARQWGYGTNVDVGRESYDIQRENALESAKLAQENAYNAYVTNYNTMYQQAQDRYKPGFRTWEEEQLAGRQASRDQWGRQWDAYRYAQPSATTMYQYQGPQIPE